MQQLITAFIITILTLVLMRILDIVLDKYFDKLVKIKNDAEFEKRIITLKFTLVSMVNIVVCSIGFTIALAKLGIEIGPILTAAGVLGVAVGFGAQRFIQDIITGFLLLIEDQIRVGDVVKIGDKSGLVEKVDLKMVVLRDISGNVHYIRNGKIETVTNMTRDYSYYVLDIGVSFNEDIDKSIEIIQQIDAELRQDEKFKDVILEPIEILGLDKFDDSVVIIKARIKTMPAMQWTVGREFNRRLKNHSQQGRIWATSALSPTK